MEVSQCNFQTNAICQIDVVERLSRQAIRIRRYCQSQQSTEPKHPPAQRLHPDGARNAAPQSIVASRCFLQCLRVVRIEQTAVSRQIRSSSRMTTNPPLSTGENRNRFSRFSNKRFLTPFPILMRWMAVMPSFRRTKTEGLEMVSCERSHWEWQVSIKDSIRFEHGTMKASFD